MKPLTIEWVEKAEEDWDMLLRAYRARKRPAYNAACFHAQQCVEKYLKGRLDEAGIAFAKTHDPASSTVKPQRSHLRVRQCL